jgi:hypothetical protein
MGFGTIPDCTGCDHDDFIDPGAEIQITFERLGTLRCRFAEPAGKLLPSRWPVREPLQKYHRSSRPLRQTYENENHRQETPHPRCLGDRPRGGHCGLASRQPLEHRHGKAT